MSGLEHRYLEFLFLAYATTWLLALGFLGRMLKRTRRLEAEVRILRQSVLGGVESAASPSSLDSAPHSSVSLRD